MLSLLFINDFQGEPGQPAGGEPNGKCWGGYYCPAKSLKPDQIQTEPGEYTIY